MVLECHGQSIEPGLSARQVVLGNAGPVTNNGRHLQNILQLPNNTQPAVALKTFDLRLGEG